MKTSLGADLNNEIFRRAAGVSGLVDIARMIALGAGPKGNGSAAFYLALSRGSICEDLFSQAMACGRLRILDGAGLARRRSKALASGCLDLAAVSSFVIDHKALSVTLARPQSKAAPSAAAFQHCPP